MKRYNLIYYVLFLAITMGAFASMAQNSYGMKLMGFACIGFCLTFLYELFFSVASLPDLSITIKRWFSLELVALSILSLLFFFQIFLIEIPEARMGLLFILLVVFGITAFNAGYHIRRSWGMNKVLGAGVILYYSSLLFLIATFFTNVLQLSVAKILGPVGFILLLCFVILAVLFRKRILEGEKMPILSFVRRMKNRSGILFIGFILSFLFFGLNRIDVLPPLYSGEMPSGYVKLMREAESGEDKTAGKKRYEEFSEQYEKFIKKLNQE